MEFPGKERLATLPDMTHLGMGPWYAGLMMDVLPQKNQTNKTEVMLHTNLHRVERYKQNNENGYWKMLMMVGPFDDVRAAYSFYRIWAKKAKGLKDRTEWGITIFAHYHARYRLKMWHVDMSREELEAEGRSFMAKLGPAGIHERSERAKMSRKSKKESKREREAINDNIITMKTASGDMAVMLGPMRAVRKRRAELRKRRKKL